MLMLLNTLLPQILTFYKELREMHPDQPALTDEAIIDLLQSDSAAIITKAQAWLASHRPIQD